MKLGKIMLVVSIMIIVPIKIDKLIKIKADGKNKIITNDNIPNNEIIVT